MNELARQIDALLAEAKRIPPYEGDVGDSTKDRVRRQIAAETALAAFRMIEALPADPWNGLRAVPDLLWAAQVCVAAGALPVMLYGDPGLPATPTAVLDCGDLDIPKLAGVLAPLLHANQDNIVPPRPLGTARLYRLAAVAQLALVPGPRAVGKLERPLPAPEEAWRTWQPPTLETLRRLGL